MNTRRRNIDRHRVELPATLHPSGSENDVSRAVPVLVRDISLGGCSIACSQAFGVGTVWHLRFQSPQSRVHDGAVLIRSCRAFDNGEFQIGAQHVVDPALLLGSGVDAAAVAADLQTLVDDGSRPNWDVRYHVTAAEPLNACSLNAICVLARKDITVAEAVNDCTLDVAGRLNGPKASLAGGTAHVLRGVTLAELGSADRRPTLLFLGQTLSTVTMLESVNDLVSHNKAVIAQKNAAVAALRDQLAASLTHADREQLTVLMMEIPELTKQNERIDSNARRLREREESRARPRLDVAKIIHPGVTIVAGGSRISVTEPIEGPVSFGLAPNGEFGFLAPSPAAPGSDGPSPSANAPAKHAA